MFNRRQSSALKIIKQTLSNDFKQLQVKAIENIPEFSDIILYSKTCIIKAKLENDCNTIHLRIENVEGMVYELFTENYEWFLDTFYLKKSK